MLRLDTAYPKPSKEAQAGVAGAKRIPFSDVWARKEDRPLLNIEPLAMSKQQVEERLAAKYVLNWILALVNTVYMC